MSEIKLPSTLKEALADIYGSEDTLNSMRKTGVTDSGWHSYVWVKADEYATAWLRDNGYHVTDEEIMDECIGYACSRKGTKYAVFFYAYGEKQVVGLDGEYCMPLCNKAIAKDRAVLVIYINVKKIEGEDGKTEYEVYNYGGENTNILPWLVTTVQGKPVFVYYPRKELVDKLPRLIAAYNTGNLDILKAICEPGAALDAHDSNGLSLNDGFYSALMYAREKHGKMKLGYIRFNDVVYSSVGYIEGYAYVGYSVNNKSNRIDKVTFCSLDNPHEELIVLDDEIIHCEDDDVPALEAVEFLAPSEISRFSMRLIFKNGETKRYDLRGDFGSDEVAELQRKTMTDKIFANGRISNHIPKPEGMDYRSYGERGQGVEFITGAAISTTELYHDSYPVEKFNYEKYADEVHVKQFDYCEDGFGIGKIYNLDPQNPYYLLDKNTMTAKTLPKEYQKTPILIYPVCGGYSPDGLIMVSTMDEIELQYHHNMGGCAGMWGWLDKDFNVKISPKYIYAQNFEDGVAMVCKGIWDKKVIDGQDRYWCENEQWGVIDTEENEIIPCKYDEISAIDGTHRLYIVHEGGWKNGHYSIYDIQEKKVILEMDFDYDPGYMFNECFVGENDILIFDIHKPGEEEDLIYAYDLHKQEYLVHGEPMKGRTLNGEAKIVVKNKDTGDDIIVF